MTTTLVNSWEYVIDIQIGSTTMCRVCTKIGKRTAKFFFEISSLLSGEWGNSAEYRAGKFKIHRLQDKREGISTIFCRSLPYNLVQIINLEHNAFCSISS